MVRRVGVAAVLAALAVSGCADRERSVVADARLMFEGETDFRRVPVFATREVQISLSNVGRSNLTVLELWTEGDDGAITARFDHEGPHDLMSGEACTATLRFRPLHEGLFPAQLVIRSDSKEEPLLRVALTGIGVDARAKIGETRLDFGRIELGTEVTRSLSLQNPGDLPLLVTPRGVGADIGEFHFEPVTLGPFEKRTLEVVFRPTAVGRKQAALSVAPCEGCPEQPVMLVGEGLDRAIIAVPSELDFGQVPMDREQTLTLIVRNISTEPQAVTSMALGAGTDASFTHVSGDPVAMLQGGEERAIQFRYSPGHMGIATGEVVFGIGSVRNPQLRVPMAGFGGAPELCVSPDEHRFSPKPVGAKVSVSITVRNCGSSNAAPLDVSGLVVGPSRTGVGGHTQFNVEPVPLPRTLAAGEEFVFRIFYEPTEVGEHAATVGIRTNGFRASVAQVNVSGSAEPHLPCELAITPVAVSFGTVQPGHDAVLGVKIHNVGTDVCPVKNIRLADDGGGVFRMPGGEIPGVIVHAGYYFSFMVEFRAPQAPGTFAGDLQIEVSDPANPVAHVPLSANVQTSCIVATPGYLDFGIIRPGCATAPMSTTLENVCSTPVEITSVEIGPGTTDGQFVINDRPAPLPRALQPGETARVEVDYRADVTGLNLSPLFVGATGLAEPLLVPLIAEATRNGETTDSFVQQDGSKVDVLFVVDNTASMVEEHPKLVSAIPAFVAEAQRRNVDMHVAVTTTGIDPASSACPGGAEGGEAGRFFPVDGSRPRVMSLSTSNLVAALQANVQVGQCAFVEQGFEALRRALSPPLVHSGDDPRTPMANDGNAGFLREEAALAVVFVGDEDDHSPDDVDTYVDWLRSLKGRSQPQRSAIYAIAPDGSSCATAGGTGTRYAEAAAATGGEVLSVCASDYSSILQRVGGKAFSPQDRFALSGTPEPGSVRVSVNGVAVFSGWSYDSSLNQVAFSSTPAPGARIEISYLRACD